MEDKVTKKAIQDAEDAARKQGQLQAIAWVNEILDGKDPLHFGYVKAECDALKARLLKLLK